MIENENLVNAAIRYFGYITAEDLKKTGLVSIWKLIEASKEYKRNSKDIDFLSGRYNVEQAKIKRLIKEINSFIKNDFFIRLQRDVRSAAEFKDWKKSEDCRKLIEEQAYKLALNL